MNDALTPFERRLLAELAARENPTERGRDRAAHAP